MDSITQALFLAASGAKSRRLVAVGAAGLVQTSDDDGVTWDARTGDPTGSNVTWSDVIFAAGRFIAVGGQGTGTTSDRIMTSLDGETWAAASIPNTYPLRRVCDGVNSSGAAVLMAITGSNNRAMISLDGGLNWSFTTNLPESSNWSGLSRALSHGFLAVRQSGTESDNVTITGVQVGSAWVQPTAAFVASLTDVCYEPGLGAVAVAGTSFTHRVLTSNGGRTTGTIWTSRSATSMQWQSICYGNGLFVAVGHNGGFTNGAIMTSPTGVTWTDRTGPTSGRLWMKVAFRGGRFFALAHNTSFTTTYIMSSPDGINWDEVGSFAGVAGSICGGEI